MGNNYDAGTVALYLRGFVGGLLLLALGACGGGGTSGPSTSTPPATTAPTPEPEPPYWEVATPDFSAKADRAVITLNGPQTVLLPVGGEYEELGAQASDPVGTDLSEQVVVEHQIDTSKAGDYLVRYSLPDHNGLLTLDAVRVVRVGDEEIIHFSRRPFGTTMSHLGYIEHLPEDYGVDPEQRFPLLIYNHGNAANATFSGDSPVEALEAVLLNGGLPLIIRSGRWDRELPFIVLMPQASFVESSTPSERLNAFVDFALQTYAVDTSKIYMTGWSQGGFMTVDYAINYPERLAAAVSIAGGNPFNEDLPDNFCDIESVPMWIFHGENDDLVDSARSIDLYNKITQQCQATTLPRLTVFKTDLHRISHPIFNLTAMPGGEFGAEHFTEYDAYDQSIYEWLLSYSSD